MGIGRILVLALLAAAASLTLRLDAVLAAVDLTVPAASPPPTSRAKVNLETPPPVSEAPTTDDLEAALIAATRERPRPTSRQGRSALAETSPRAPAATQQDPRMVQMVKMYAAMRPKDAARIFERLDLAVQVDVALAMKDRTMAAILAEMSPDVASDLMMALAGAPRSRSDPG
ncbi:MAG: hypothetical protein AAGD40_05905 [Pseudomonadota bacterium]